MKTSTSSIPTFSVIIATYDRDEFIHPTLESVQRQTLTDFEVLVVSDGPHSEVLANTVRQFDDRFSLHALPVRSRSQGGPNNLGWSKARGRYIAYLGHDDVWHPDHLQLLYDGYERFPSADFMVSGCIFLGPPGTDDDLTWVTGIFNDDDVDAPRENFFPPSSFSHHRDLPADVPRWQDPSTLRRPVDTEFLFGAIDRGYRFRSTQQISVYKFASALRYLSYLCPDDSEQRSLLALLDDPEALDGFIRERESAAKVKGGYMSVRHATPLQFQPGENLQINERTRGIALPETTDLIDEARLDVGEDARGFDWYGIETHGDRRWRWSGPNHHPRLFVPFTCDNPVRITLEISQFASDDIKDSIRVTCNGHPRDVSIFEVTDGYEVVFITSLRTDGPSVVELHMNRTAPASEIDPNTMDTRKLGLCLTGITLADVMTSHTLISPKNHQALQDRYESLRRERDDALEIVRAIEGSTSWRWTAWLRALRAKVSRTD